MSQAAHSKSLRVSAFQQMAMARDIIQSETRALRELADRLPIDFPKAVSQIVECRGAVIVTGIGKAGWIGQKLSASFASTGTRSHFVHPGEAIHGDLGRVGEDDVVLVLSNSGETEEITRLLPSFRSLQVPIIAITGKPDSTLAKQASVVLDFGNVREACPLGLAPTTSTTMMLVLGDALALVTSEVRSFTSIDFAKYHPGGSLGRKLAIVDEMMRPLDRCRVANQRETVRETLVTHHQSGRRSGAILLVDDSGNLVGLFTDSDLARLLEDQRDAALDEPIDQVMTRKPLVIASGSRMSQAIETLASRSISELPVVAANGKPLGMIDITDIVGTWEE
jgi:arabinose-5-phosphate isomerase